MANEHINRVDIVRSGSTQTLIDITDTTAVAADVAQGKYFYLATGEKVQGSASSGTGGITQDANGYLVLSDTGGGGGGGESWSWMGKNPTLVKTYAKEKVYFKDTSLPSWTWSTTASDIVAATAYGDTFTADLTQYGYLVIYKLHVHYDYGNWTPVKAVTDYSRINCCYEMGYYSTVNAVQSGEYNSAVSYTSDAQHWAYYNNSSGVKTMGQVSYGLFTTNTVSLTANGSLSSETITVTKPKLRAQGNDSYFTADAFNNIDMNASYCEIVTEVWRVDSPTSARQAVYEEVINVLDNGF